MLARAVSLLSQEELCEGLQQVLNNGHAPGLPKKLLSPRYGHVPYVRVVCWEPKQPEDERTRSSQHGKSEDAVFIHS